MAELSSPSTPRRLPRVEDFPEAGPNALAAFAQRAWARLIDFLIVVLGTAVVLLVVMVVALNTGMAADEHLPTWALLLPPLAVAAVYDTVAIGGWGTSVGKLAQGIRVARYTDGGKPTWEQAALRALVPVAADAGMVIVFASLFGSTAYPVAGAILVYTSARTNPLRRGWHDVAGGTVVVRNR